MGVHDDDTCGSDFSELAKDITSLLRQESIQDALRRLEQCKAARLDESIKHGGMNDEHVAAYNLVEHLQDCIYEIHKTVKFAEVYGGRTTLTFEPSRFVIELSVRGGKRIYTVKVKGYESRDLPS
jgi:hypothetical protein